MPRALLSVSDKTGLIDFARELHARGWTLLSTGGTARALREADLPVTEVAEITGHPEMMDGRVKTLHPAVHAGLLGRRAHADDMAQMAAHGYETIDLVAVNLYPFRETVARPGATLEDAIENIDIGGPSMLRSASKNHESVWVVVDPADYGRVLDGLNAGGGLALRRELAAKVYGHTAEYDRAIAEYLTRAVEADSAPSADQFPSRVRLSLTRVQDLRYGENPDQPAAFYREDGAAGGLADLRQLHGKELSFNNLIDVDGAVQAISAWADSGLAACAIIKHTTPCGIAVGADAAEAYQKALKTDPTSAFGSVIAFNVPVTQEAAVLLRPNFVEAIVAPSFVEGAVRLLTEKKNLRLLELPSLASADDELDWKRVRGGFVAQQRLSARFPEDGWKVVTARAPSEEEMDDLRFAWRAVAPVKSNAILIARGGMALGIGAGQMSRVDSSRIAVMKAAENGFDLAGAALASDAFFPFRDGVDAAALAGIRAIIQPGGSVRDEEVIAAADEHGIAMVFTGRRLFRH
ncbi:bifunctional phosphoribosylaminoimidazolecarboxamide formyltransferase/IMP cyclohydrolase [Longimicrobium terrae]|uniref:Bifunctional purine biosynthesis protein PurH n=1 Tax=Longimicrobium terrae TaxID=1639882 RepID=A0A841H7B0_9BACT|nr:bifunctional phosphoribosylaminoimidazolecarboxamide formyltransferase/IMP cyclohydrolase [Longimicrobium terrae]MBB4639429.1 phosphoribosylaminoimidazolecarboxamide formyltransferase/IMP cyclohydrolase [Longimicrobium terrae]MBB6073736.1 phosphoribosylaminoimidazolecarboxamide formyltransferase/IMP cyclohydrolase [Longimicrobium terrae]NNC30678.1 bifunctional phosphoribosylaminoimidazolecarboxamide formyltransferase/IMP cyclohydrolase [Longimicrobium terrae]